MVGHRKRIIEPWTGYKTFRYQDCSGFLTCPNAECGFFLQHNKLNKARFTKIGACKICSIQGDWFKKLFQQTPTQDRKKFKVTLYYLIYVAGKGGKRSRIL